MPLHLVKFTPRKPTHEPDAVRRLIVAARALALNRPMAVVALAEIAERFAKPFTEKGSALEARGRAVVQE